MTARESRVQSTADLFRSFEFGWIDSRELEIVGGRNAWRTRVSDCRLQLGMRIDNRLTRRTDGTLISEYRYVPTPAQSLAAEAA